MKTDVEGCWVIEKVGRVSNRVGVVESTYAIRVTLDEHLPFLWDLVIVRSVPLAVGSWEAGGTYRSILYSDTVRPEDADDQIAELIAQALYESMKAAQHNQMAGHIPEERKQ